MEWERVTIASKSIIDKYCKGRYNSSDLNFTNFIVWSISERIEYREDNEILYVRGDLDGKEYYFPPLPKEKNENTVEKLSLAFKNILENNGRILFIPEEIKNILEDKFTFSENRDFFDYIYLSESLESLKGRKYAKKKNKISQFKKLYEYEVESINKENLKDVKEFQKKWFEMRKEDPMIRKENKGVELLLENFELLGLLGIVIRVENKIIGYSLGEILNENMILVHTEKALPEYRGSYQMVNKLFVCYKGKDKKYINREDDSGIEGLREAKMSYFPEILYKKYELGN